MVQNGNKNTKLNRTSQTYRSDPTSSVVPNSLIAKLHGVGMLSLLKVSVGMPVGVPPAAHVATDQAYP